MISLLKLIKEAFLSEKLTFTQLFNFSEPKRKDRSKGVRVSSLPGTASETNEYWNFSYKSNPSTTGLRWRGRITFFKSTHKEAADKMYCNVDCSCPDYKYKWAYANADKDAGITGPNSLSKNNGAYPVVTNKNLRPGLCKHLLSLKDYLKTKLHESQQPDINLKLTEVVAKNRQFQLLVEE